MSNVIGPIDREDWSNMIWFRRSLKWYNSRPDRERFKYAIEKETSIVKDLWKKILPSEAA